LTPGREAEPHRQARAALDVAAEAFHYGTDL